MNLDLDFVRPRPTRPTPQGLGFGGQRIRNRELCFVLAPGAVANAGGSGNSLFRDSSGVVGVRAALKVLSTASSVYGNEARDERCSVGLSRGEGGLRVG